MWEHLFYGDYWLAKLVIQKALGIIYLLAFLVARNQFPALLGTNGLLPVPRFTKRVPFRIKPSIFHWYYSDYFLEMVSWTGIILSIIAISGLLDGAPVWVYMLVWFLLWCLYQSIVNVGQLFYGFGWESMLLEFGFYAIFLGPLDMATPVLVIWMIRWMLFRVEFGAGLIKIRGDQCWRDLTCMYYHHETQPMPNPLSRYFHLTPKVMHRVETFFNHCVQLGVIWGIFLPQPFAGIAGVLIILSQGYLVISGNYSWLNWMTIILAVSCFNDGLIQEFLPVEGIPSTEAAPVFFQVIVAGITLLIIYLSIEPVRNLISKFQLMNYSFNPFHLVNTYGAFGSVTKKRFEIIIEGTTDEFPDVNTEWFAYEFKGKPGDLKRRPPQVAPYHLRLDWQIWFSAMQFAAYEFWFRQMILKLLNNDPEFLKLIRYNPFKENPPVHIRALRYHYEYTTPKEKKETGQYWKRTFVNEYMPPVSKFELLGYF